MGVSRVPLREALKLLEAQGIVEVLPHRGTWVVPFDDARVDRICEARVVLERLALRTAVPAFRPIQRRLATLDGLIDAMRLAARRQAWLEVSKADLAFHRTMVEASGNDIVVEAVGSPRPPRADRVRAGSADRTSRTAVGRAACSLARPTGGGRPANSAPPDRAAHPAPAAWYDQLTLIASASPASTRASRSCGWSHRDAEPRADPPRQGWMATRWSCGSRCGSSAALSSLAGVPGRPRGHAARVGLISSSPRCAVAADAPRPPTRAC